jgi:hypothetical protein
MSTFGGHDYLLCKELRSWSAANDGCIASGMRLIRIDSASENQWLYDNANIDPGRNSLVWIGATDQAVEGQWRWTDGDLFWIGDSAGMAQNGFFEAWYQREPNNVVPAENCGALETAGSVAVWYDKDCVIGQPFACESL